MDALSPVRIDPAAHVDTEAGALHVITARGAFTLEAPGIDRLHAALSPHLTGTHDRPSLLAALPAPQRPAVDAYLDRLTDAGLFALPHDGAAPSATGHLADGRRAVVRSTPGASDADVTVLFCRADAVLAEVVRLEEGVRLIVVSDALPSKATRQQVADWLLSHEAGAARGAAAVAVFSLDGPCLNRVLSFADRPPSLESLVRQLGVVRPTSRPALPLATLRAEHDWLPGIGFTTVGVGFEDVHPRATRRARALLGASLVGARPSPVTSVVGPTEGAVRQRLLERLAGHASHLDGVPTDLASTPTNGLRVAFLTEALRLRGRSTEVTVGAGPGGVAVVGSEAKRWAATDKSAAIEAALIDRLAASEDRIPDAVDRLDDASDEAEGAVRALSAALPEARFRIEAIDGETWLGTPLPPA